MLALSKPSLSRVALALLLLLPVATAADDQAKQEASGWTSKAIELSGIETAGSAPFRLQVRFHFPDMPADAGDGKYILVWASAEQWRREITYPGYSEVAVGGKDKEWRLRNISYRPLWMQRVTSLLNGILAARSESNLVVKKVRETKLDGVPMRCAQVSISRPGGGAPYESERCFDSATGLLLRTSNKFMVEQYSDYQPFLGKQFPFRMVLSEGGRPAVEAQVEALTPAQPEASLFVSPAGAEEWPVCPAGEAQPPRADHQPDPQFPRGAMGSADVTLYVVVGVDGRVHNPVLVGSGGPAFDQAALDAVTQWRFKPATCHGAAIPAEINVEVTFHPY